jgi:hypothetical protein
MLDRFNFSKVIEKMEQVKKDLPRLLANDTKNYFVGEYNNQEWNGQKWKEVQRRIPGTNAYKYPKKGADSRHGSAILVRTGKLRRDVTNSLEVATFDKIKFTVRNDYGQYHNEGGDKLPKRKFMGQTNKLRDIQLNRIKDFINKIWQA